VKLLGNISVGFDITDELLIRYFALVRNLRKNGGSMRQYISYSYTSRKLMIQLGGKYFVVEFGVPMELVRLIKMWLKETYSKVRIGIH
jgi:hypothetical protein